MARSNLTPIARRVQWLDALRGFALLGIFLSIIRGFNLSLPYAEAFAELEADRFSRLWISLHEMLIAQRFIAIFSFLFGIGIAIQQKRFAAKQVSFLPYHFRRMFLLGILGLINTTFFWWGEILLIYAVFGILLSMFLKANMRLLATAAFLIYVVIHPIWVVHFSEAFAQLVRGPFLEVYQPEAIFRIYREGGLRETISARWREYLALFAVNDQWMRTSFTLMLLGYGLVKFNYLGAFVEEITQKTKWLIVSGVITVLFSLIAWRTGVFYVTLKAGPAMFFANSLWLLSSTYFYIHLFILLHEKTPLRRALGLFGFVGRMSLSNYLLCACIYSFIFHNQGLGLYAKLPVWTEAPIALSTYLLLALGSSWWLKRFQYGPLERIWRSFSYGRI